MAVKVCPDCQQQVRTNLDVAEWHMNKKGELCPRSGKRIQ